MEEQAVVRLQALMRGRGARSGRPQQQQQQQQPPPPPQQQHGLDGAAEDYEAAYAIDDDGDDVIDDMP